MHSSEVLVTPSGIAPAARSRLTAEASRGARYARRAASPEVWGIPVRAKHSLMVQGTPWRGPTTSGPSSANWRSASSASARATA